MTMLGQFACGCGCSSVFGVLEVYVFDYARGVVSGLTLAMSCVHFTPARLAVDGAFASVCVVGLLLLLRLQCVGAFRRQLSAESQRCVHAVYLHAPLGMHAC